ncbi:MULTISPECIES: hypothetical protein [Pseudomonas]|uniref:hypothetical protein n=1 Tax=Pseudomonas TaxID=286 RepID=UPI00102339EB|nr:MULTISPECIES: hypothetical protein [Pseudomonas]MDO4236121.1 hypothetical protein [Pseudomonas sp.]RZI21717.1 hypothetical protein EUX53_16530 [Pseudomonas orientalis]
MQTSIFTRLDALSCTDLSDAMDRLNIVCQCTDIMPLDRTFKLTGKAWTPTTGVQPDDWLRGDGDGLVVIPAGSLSQVLAVAEEIHQAEEHIRAAIEAGVPLRRARADYGYHALQTPRR